jgi:amino acid transporter
MRLSATTAVGLFVWYISIFSAGIYLLLSEILAPTFFDTDGSILSALRCSLGGSLASSGAFYIRKLYKELFSQSAAEQRETNSQERMATFFYFFSRPLFSILFAVIVVLTFSAFIHATTNHGTKVSIGFVLVSALLSMYGAAATGRIVERLESLGVERLRNFGGN